MTDPDRQHESDPHKKYSGGGHFEALSRRRPVWIEAQGECEQVFHRVNDGRVQ